MTACIILDDLRARGIAVAATPNGSLAIDAPRGALTPAVVAELAEHKAELVALLTEAAAPVPPPSPLDSLVGPRLTPWGTLVWSDLGEPPIEAFGD